MLKIVATAGIFSAALKSAGGASNALLRRTAYRRVTFLVNVPLMGEYEAEIKHAEQRLVHGRSLEAIDRFIATIASASEPVATNRLWRPRLSNPIDELILQIAVDGCADAIVTHDPRRFSIASLGGVRVCMPAEILREL